MRKARYSLKQVILPKASTLGYGQWRAKPGYWILYHVGTENRLARVLGRIDETDSDGMNCTGYIAAIRLMSDASHAFVDWVNPADVTYCLEKPPSALLAWITGDEWVKNKENIAHIIAMAQYGTLSESFINSRNEPDKEYNTRPEYAKQWILE